MTQATHTRGPFGISRNATPDYAPQFGIYAETGNGRDLATVTGENAASDAALFAAAPDMLAALKNALADLEGIMPEFDASGDRTHPAWQTIRDIRDAIAKAKGEY